MSKREQVVEQERMASARVQRIEAIMARINAKITDRFVHGGKYPTALFRAVWILAAARADALGNHDRGAWIRRDILKLQSIGFGSDVRMI